MLVKRIISALCVFGLIAGATCAGMLGKVGTFNGGGGGVDANLKVHWNFDTNADPGVDDGIDGTNTADIAEGSAEPTHTTNGTEAVYSFDGTDDFIDSVPTPDWGGLTSGLTISCWVNKTNVAYTGAIETFICKEGNAQSQYVFALTLDDSANPERLHFYMRNKGANAWIGRRTGDGGLTTNGWQHIAARWDGGTSSGGIDVIVNGNPIDTTDYNGASFTALNDGVGKFIVGQYWNGLYEAAGLIDDVRFYDVEKTVAFISNVYETTKGNYGL